MTRSPASTSDLEDFAVTGPDMVSTACVAALARVRNLMAVPPAVADVVDIANLTGIARRIDIALDLAAESDDATATLKLGHALALMNALRLTMAGDGPTATPPLSAQKSGSTG